jgi:hypothetical protein
MGEFGNQNPSLMCELIENCAAPFFVEHLNPACDEIDCFGMSLQMRLLFISFYFVCPLETCGSQAASEPSRDLLNCLTRVRHRIAITRKPQF